MLQGKLTLALFVVMGVCFMSKEVSGVCCYAVAHGVCGDCSKSSPFCATGRCNIFGCNCDGHCRDGQCGMTDRGKRSVGGVEISAADGIILEADADKDGVLSVEEAAAFLKRNGISKSYDWVLALDKNGDGNLAAEEIDTETFG